MSTVIAENFVRVKISYSSVRGLSYAKVSYCKGDVTDAGIRVWFSYAKNFRTFSQKYET